MESSTHNPSVEAAFRKAENSVRAYGALSTVALLAVIAVAAAGRPANTFMWVRAILLPLVAVLLYRLTVAASRGSRRAFGRVSTVARIMPIAIIGVDLIPGVCPLWYAATQAVCMLPVIRIAVIAHRCPLRSHFRGQHPSGCATAANHL